MPRHLYSIRMLRIGTPCPRMRKRLPLYGCLWLLEADVYNGGFVQFFCNWGEEAYIRAVRALQAIGAVHALEIVQSGYACIEHLSEDNRLTQLWDIPKFLTEEEVERLDKLDKRFWEDHDHIAEIAYRYYVQELGITVSS